MSLTKRKSGDNGPITPLPGQTSFLDKTQESRSPSDQTIAGATSNGPLTGEVTPRSPLPDEVEESPIINPFDPDRIRIGTDYGDLAAGRSADLTFPVWNRPPKAAWFRAHPTNEVDVLMLDLTADDSDGLYFLDKSLWPDLVHESTVGLRLLVHCQTRQGTDFLWAIKLKSPFDKRQNAWTASALKERELARSRWVRHRSNRELGAYDPLVSDLIDAEPEWPALTFTKILEIALKDRYINSLEHEILVELLKGK
jgi:hypothetical protein